MVVLLVNLLPLLPLRVHCYPERTAKLRPRYKSAAAERWTRSRQWELFHCSVVYTMMRSSAASILLFQFRYDIDTIFTKYRDIDIDINIK